MSNFGILSIFGMAAGPGIPITGTKCPQCGNYHPPIASNSICPMAGMKSATNKTEEIEGLTEFYSTMNNIIKRNIAKQNLKDTKKILQHITLLTAKYFENITNLKNKEG